MFALAFLPLTIFFVLLSLVLLCLGKWRCALAVLILAIGVNAYTQQVPLNLQSVLASGSPDSHVRKLRIFEYNVCAKSDFRVLHDSVFIDYILAQDADILFLPENLYYTDKVLDSVLNEHYPYSVYRQLSQKEWPEEMGIYSRYRLEDIRRLIVNDSLVSNSLISATATVDGRKLGLLFAHCCSNRNGFDKAYALRDAEAAALVNELKGTFADTPYIILAGDLNDVNGSPLLNALKQAGLKDAWWEAGHGFGFTYVNGWLRFRLDHIMLSETIAVENIEIDSKAPWSDHRPMVADIALLNF